MSPSKTTYLDVFHHCWLAHKDRGRYSASYAKMGLWATKGLKSTQH